MSNFTLDRDVRRLNQRVTEICDRFDIGQPSDDMKKVLKRLQLIEERLDALESDPVTVTTVKNGSETQTRHIPKQRSSRKALRLS